MGEGSRASALARSGERPGPLVGGRSPLGPAVHPGACGDILRRMSEHAGCGQGETRVRAVRSFRPEWLLTRSAGRGVLRRGPGEWWTSVLVYAGGDVLG